jgi:metal-dependent amidase/aminoacylase/carboxypeptidase family protein
VNYERIYPATINSRDEARFAADVAQRLVGHDHVDRAMDPSMGAEDFSFMLQVKPGAYLRLGQGLESGMGGCICTTAATTSTTMCCRWAPPCMPA